MSGITPNRGLSIGTGISKISNRGLTQFTGLTNLGIAPVISYNFLSGSVPSDLTFTRASSGNYFNSLGILVSASNNVARFDYGSPGSSTLQGLLIEQATTNTALWARDMTQVNWVKVTMTTALNQVGIDNVSNSASLLTASLGNATILQTITQAATTSAYSVYIKRVSGSGVVNITQNGGVGWTPVALTTSWKRFTLQASILNPAFGIQIVTSGDSIAVDYNQFEPNAAGSTSPIATTSASVSRSIDLISTSSIPWYNALKGTAILQLIPEAYVGSNSSTFNFNDGTANNIIQAFYTSGALNANITVSAVGNSSGGLAAPVIGSLLKVGVSYLSGNNNGASNGSLVLGASFLTSTIPSGINHLNLGNRSDGARMMNGWLRQFNYWNYPFTAAQLASATT